MSDKNWFWISHVTKSFINWGILKACFHECESFKYPKASHQLSRTKITPGTVLEKSFKELEEIPLIIF